jgi:dTDP-4-dehydrorhamnose reductase
MKILLIGCSGQLGWELSREAQKLGELVCVDYPQIDLAQPSSIRELLNSVNPDLVINAAAYTNVDKAESEPELARMVNAIAPAILAEEMLKRSGALIHYSTDYVYDGTKGAPYTETDEPHPINVYGATKLEGDRLVAQIHAASLILRTSWVYSRRPGGFLPKVLQWAHQQQVVRVVDDQAGSPTWARMLAQATVKLISGDAFSRITELGGLYHLAGSGSVSRFEWAQEIIAHDPQKGTQTVNQVLPAKSSDFPTPAKRPAFTALSVQKITSLGIDVPDWKISLYQCLESASDESIG